MKIRDVMNSKVVTVTPDTTVKHAYELMRQGGFRHLPVIDRAGKLAGIISDRDVRNVAVLFKKRPKDPTEYMIDEKLKVNSIMTPHPITIGPADTVLRAVTLFESHQIGCLPVIDKDKLAGILTRQDLLFLLTKLLKKS
jgi:acetoin utilization protein AcuB